MEHEHRTLTPEVAKFYATSLGDVFTPDGDAGVIDTISSYGRVYVTGWYVHDWFYVDQLTYDHTDYLRAKAART